MEFREWEDVRKALSRIFTNDEFDGWAKTPHEALGFVSPVTAWGMNGYIRGALIHLVRQMTAE
jgi:hypothetical protein